MYLAAVARFYDWCYAALTADQRRNLLDWLKESAEYSNVRNTSAGAYQRNDGAVVTHGMAAFAFTR